MSSPRLKNLASSAAGGAATAHGVQYQVRYAMRLALALMSDQMAAPHIQRVIAMEPRQVNGPVGTAWDISTGPDQSLVEAKLQPTASDIAEWVARVKDRGSAGTEVFDLVYSDRGGRLESLRRLTRIAREAPDAAQFDRLVAAEKVKDDFEILKSFGAQSHELLRRMTLLQCPEVFLEGEITLYARFLVGVADAQRAVDLLENRLLSAMAGRVTFRISTLISALEEAGMRVYAPPQLDTHGLDPEAIEALYALSVLREPIPLEVLAAARHLKVDQLRHILQPMVDAMVIQFSGDNLMSAPSMTGLQVADPDTTLASVLDALVNYLSSKKPDAVVGQVRNVGRLAQRCKDSRPKSAAASFHAIDKALKQLGDKHEVLKAANLSVDAARHTADISQRSRQLVEQEAHALICGVSWVYQRVGRLPEARVCAANSLALGEGIGWDQNSAFCKKCIGRLCRMEAEQENDTDAKASKFQLSIDLLKKAIEEFSRLSDFGPEHAEVGDCFSLLGRTYLSMGHISDADASTRKSLKLLSEKDGKDYIDLVILIGDIAVAQEKRVDAQAWYDEAIRISKDRGAEVSEMRARAFRQRGKLRQHLSNKTAAIADLRIAAEIWHKLGENESAASALWDAWKFENNPSPTVSGLLEKEKAAVRMRTIESHQSRLQEHRKASVARREEPPVEYWRQLIKEAKTTSAIEDVLW